MTTYSLVIPVHNEAEVLPHLFGELERVADRLDAPAEFVLVDDGSSDASWPMMVEGARLDDRYRLVRLSRNFGHQAAVTAGIEHAVGAAVVIMDADLQDPPEVVLEMARRWREGHHIAYGLRVDRDDDTWFKRSTAGAFYRAMNSMATIDIPAQVGDFRLIDRSVVDVIRGMPEHNRYLRGMFSWIGFSQVAVPYDRPARRAGTTSYSLRRMVSLAGDGVVGFSKAPLRAILATGVATLAAGAIGTVASVAAATITGRARSAIVPSLQLIGVGAQLAGLGVVGEYAARNLDESTGRPLYVVREVVGTPAALRADELELVLDDRGDLLTTDGADLRGWTRPAERGDVARSTRGRR